MNGRMNTRFFISLFIAVIIVLSVAPAPVLAQGATNIVVVDTGAANIRSGPAANTTILGSVRGGIELPVTGRNYDTSWWRVVSPYGIGWISSELVVFRGILDAVPVVTQPVGTLELPQVIVDRFDANVYRNPNRDSFVLGIAPTGSLFFVSGLTVDGDWWQIDTPVGLGYISVDEAVLRGDLDLIPVVYDPGPSFEGPTIRVNTQTPVTTAPAGGDVIGTLTPNTALPAYGRTADNTWWQVSGPFGAGWIPVKDISLVGSAGNIDQVSGFTSYAGGVPTGEAAASILIEAERKVAYNEASYTSAPMWDAYLGERGNVIARSLDGMWLQVVIGNYDGWMDFSGITLYGDMSLIPAVDTTPPPIQNIVIINTGRLNIRNGPGVEYASIGSVTGGTSLDVTGKHPTLPWIRVEHPIWGTGWVRIMYIIFRGNWNEVPYVEEPVGTLEMPQAYILVPHNVYSQPDFAYPTGVVAPGMYTIIGRTADFQWALIETETDIGPVWIRFEEFELRGIADSAPVVWVW
ncbi:MAG: SH3 domain-containing protein [Chloroflexi bacterium]|nr:SH3 domain-containing protein [Chloroflexota bacterium]